MITISPYVRSAIIIYVLIMLYILLKRKDWILTPKKKKLQELPLTLHILPFPILTLVIAILVYYLVILLNLELF